MATSTIKQSAAIKRQRFSTTTGSFGEAELNNSRIILKVECNEANVVGLIYSNGLVAFRSMTTWEPVANQTVTGTYYYCSPIVE